jgi:signal transduction histidine kinase
MREVRVDDIDKRISQALATLRDGSALRTDYWVVDRSGRVVASSDPSLLASPPGWAAAAMPPVGEEGAHLVGDRLVISAPIPDPDDARRVLGTLVGVLSWPRITALADEVRRELVEQGLEAQVLVCRSDGTILGGTRGSEGASTPSAERLRAMVEGVSTVAGRTTLADGRRNVDDADWIVGRASLASDLPEPFASWRLLVVEPRSEALGPARALSERLLATMGLLLLAALAAAGIAARRVVRPLSELTRAIRGLARGESDARRVPVRSDDELGALAGAFNQMAGDLDRAQHELIEAEKFAFVGELAAGVAHEIRTSLGVLRSSAQLLRQSLPPDANGQTSELAQMLGAEVDRLGRVVNELLTLDRPHPPRLESVPASEPLLRAVEFVRPKAQEKAIRIEAHLPGQEPRIRCEPDLAYRVAVNLLVNALQAVGEGGCIEADVLEADGGFGGFSIRDDGPGIPPESIDRIFQPFVTARAGGVGLGLTFVKRVVHDHRGQVHVESSPDAGTCFRVELPLAEDDA